MATTSDTHRAAIRQRRQQAHIALRERHQRQEAAHAAAFSALVNLAHQLDLSAAELAVATGDPLERAVVVASIARRLDAEMLNVRRAATDLATVGALTQVEVAELVGVRAASLFPRTRARRSRAPAAVAARPCPRPAENAEVVA